MKTRNAKIRKSQLATLGIVFLKASRHQKQRLEGKLEKEKLLMGQLPGLSLQILELVKSRGRIIVKEAVTITNANRSTVKRHLETMVKKNHLRQNGTGKGTWYSMV